MFQNQNKICTIVAVLMNVLQYNSYMLSFFNFGRYANGATTVIPLRACAVVEMPEGKEVKFSEPAHLALIV